MSYDQQALTDTNDCPLQAAWVKKDPTTCSKVNSVTKCNNFSVKLLLFWLCWHLYHDWKLDTTTYQPYHNDDQNIFWD